MLPLGAGVSSVDAAAASAPVNTTDGFYSDIIVYSPRKKFRLEAKLPNNAGATTAPFASKFGYALYDEASGEKVWERKQPYGESSPLSAFITDSGDVVVLADVTLFSLAPKDGRKCGTLRILDQFSKEESSKYIAKTTAGQIWASGSRWSFIEVDGEAAQRTLLFVVRTYWGHWVVMDVATGTSVDLGPASCGDLAKAEKPAQRKLVQAILDDEAAWAVKVLNDATGAPPQFLAPDARFDVYTAATIAGQRQLRGAIKPLRELEKDDDVTGSSSNGARWRQLRQFAQLALRRLGEVPAAAPAVSLSPRTGELFPRGPEYSSKILVKDRAGNIDEVKPDMKAKDLIDAIGFPDCSVYDQTMGHAFDYDIDAPEPFTLRVVIDKDNVVTKIRRINPPVWKDGCVRERALWGGSAG